MNRVLLTALLLSFFLVPYSHTQSRNTGILEITFTGIRSTKGLMAIGINKSPEGWPRNPDMDPNWKKTNITSGSMTVQVKDLPYGIYAVSVLDDENSNLEMNNFLGIPKEGYGFSNDAEVKMSPPKFEECSFVIDQPVKKISIEIRYMRK